MTVGWSTAGMARIAELVREHTGLIFPELRQRDVEAAIRKAMAPLGLSDPGQLPALLHDDAVAREAFIAELTIGESYFQRDPSQLELLRRRILPELLQSRPHDRPVRVWSAGCATGEEPYTVAMMFDELGAIDRCDIVGTDIARSRLADAQRGLYSKWQLRATPESIRTRYFTERGRYFELSPRLRRCVDFRYLNLAEDSFPSLPTGIWGMDLILCRNVLIYFDAHTIERVAQRLISSLSEDGWLLLGASDPAISEMVECDVVLTEAGLAWRRKGAASTGDIRTPAPAPPPDVAPVEQAPPPPDEWQSPVVWDDGEQAQEDFTSLAPSSTLPTDVEADIVRAYEQRAFDQVRDLAAAASGRGTLGIAAWTVWVRALANEGRLDEAAAVLMRAIREAGSSAELLYLHAVLLLQSGQHAESAAAARRALYMDRSLIVAHLTLAEAQRRGGRVDAARRSLRHAAALLSSLAADDVVPASDGESAGRLAELVRVKLTLLGSGAGHSA